MNFGTSRLKDRILAIEKLNKSGYKVGILIAPIILLDNWKELYENLIKELSEKLDNKLKKELNFEFIFMTYSYVHKMINQDAFPAAIKLYNENLMTGRGKGKYMYKKDIREEGEIFIRKIMKKYFPDSNIAYIV